ncbi:hypothetical protein Clacol_005566 [Clathrus columnatus]|uniref:CAF17 C-terminal domain-containing protein n=1 Tax=Clathrus columnatus TaxID=1419009 RepID=A0AAV5AF60_9AGAM|nr:hypothetical protein Clacol_005566 [Clathrus columnatus]
MSFNRCARIHHRAFLSITGPHSTQFLHGILSTGPPQSSPRGGFFTAFLHAQGRVLYDAFVYRHPSNDDGYLIEFDSRPSQAPPLLSLLKRYILRSKVKITDVSDEWDVWAAWGDGNNNEVSDRKWRWSRSGAVEPLWESEEWPWGGVEDRLLIRDRRAYGMGRRRVISKGLKPPESANHDVVSYADYTLHRVERCIPEGIDDITPLQAFPMESNLDIMGGLDFRKGCYVGQELTVRVYHTGIIRKRIYPIILEHINAAGVESNNITALSPGMDIITVQSGESREVARPRPSGKLLTTVGNRGLALLRMEQVEGPNRSSFSLNTDKSWRLTPFRPSHWPPPENPTS